MDEKYMAQLIETEARSKSNTHRLDEHDKQLKELSNVYVALTKVDDKVTNVEGDVSEIKQDIKAIKDGPRKKLDQVWGYLISGAIGVIITFIATQLGLK